MKRSAVVQGMPAVLAEGSRAPVSHGTLVKNLRGNLMDLIRLDPIPMLLIGLGIGFLLVRSLSKPNSGQGD